MCAGVRFANQLPEQIERLIVESKKDKPHSGARKIRELLVRKLANSMGNGRTRRSIWLALPSATTHRRDPIADYRSSTIPSMTGTFSSPHAAASAWQERRSTSRPCWRSRLGIKEVEDGIWLVSFMDYDLG
ncbi:hypothetical protein [Chelativorans sp. Marseille-P2723]|uniref:hypothetical protein n=1 Tax=Chelativorans sp. Marseille-P2723 TaxID=2709133 RepID=UPI001FED2BAA|nr:hypothetical protein [Chelativorans sp. Marseille-P2723]